MRVSSLALSLVTLAALATAPSAQPTSSAAPGFYGRAGVNGGYWGGNFGVVSAPSVAAGVRLPSGLEIGGYVTRVGYGRQASVLAFGPEVSITRALGPSTTLDLRATGGVGLYSGNEYNAAYQGVTGLAAALEANVTRRFDLGRGIDLATTGGAYASAVRLSGFDSPTAPTSEIGSDAGVLVGVQLEFDALGGRFAIGPSGGLSLLNSGQLGTLGAIPYLGTLRNRGLISFSF